MQALTRILPALLLLLAAAPIAAQYRSEMRTADKQLELNAYHLAIESYQRALAARPGDQTAQARLGLAYRMINELDSARTYYEAAMKDRNVEPAVLLGYGFALRGLGEYALARPVFEAYNREEKSGVGEHYANACTFALRQRDEDAGFQVTRLAVNSLAPDFGPSVPQADRLVFSSARADADFDGVVANRPYVATRSGDGSATDPVAISFGYTMENGYVGPVSYSPDGRQVVFSRNNFTPGTRMIPEAGITLNLMIADVNAEGRWTNVRPLPFNGSTFSSGFGTFAGDASTLYFASDRPGGFGGWDIYRATFDGQRWSETPENVGKVVNSVGNEITPYFDGSSLFFSSNWHQGLGAYDVFRAELEGERPVTLYHMGGAVNSPRDDYGFVYDPGSQTGYVVSNRPGERNADEDIFYVSPKAGGPAPTVAARPEPGKAPVATRPSGVSANDPVPFGAVRGYVTDIRSNEPVADADVTVTPRSGEGKPMRARSDVNGAYYVSLEAYTTYDVAVRAAGFEPITFPVTSDGGQKRDLLGNILLLPATEGTTTAPAAEPAAAAPAPSPAVYDTSPAAPSPAPGVETFALQIASLSRVPDAARFTALGELGPVYAVQDGDRVRVRIGGFASRNAAQDAAERAAELDFPGGFAVPEGTTSRTYLVGNAPAPTPAPTVAPTTPAPAAQNEATPAGTAYRVQLGAFGKPENFDRERAASLGSLGSELRGNLTVFYIDEIESADYAETVRQRAVDLGYSGAYVLKRTANGYEKL